VRAGRAPFDHFGFVNPPIYRGSTVLFPTVAALEALRQPYTYGTKGTPTTRALEQGWSEIAGAADTVLTPSGLAAIGLALLTATMRAMRHRFRLSADADLPRRSSRASGSPTIMCPLIGGTAAMMENIRGARRVARLPMGSRHSRSPRLPTLMAPVSSRTTPGDPSSLPAA
jgi:cystathionine beta-lyase/cystathionine gamma-synthase